MRRSIVIIIVLVLLGLSGKGKSDTLTVDSLNTVYLIFEEDVDLIDLGSSNKAENPTPQTVITDNFALKYDGNTVFIKALKKIERISTLLVRVGGEHHFYYIKYTEPNKKHYYHFGNGRGPSEVNGGSGQKPQVGKGEDEEQKEVPLDTVKARVEKVKGAENEERSLGFKEAFMNAGVTVIRNDREYTYLKVVIDNRSSLPYKLDFISFQYVRRMNKGFLKKKKEKEKDVFPKVSPSIDKVPGGEVKSLGYAIPSFALANNGYLVVSFREKSGDRVLKIEVPSKKIQNSEKIE